MIGKTFLLFMAVLGTLLAQPPGGLLRFNELDYDQPGADTLEYVELIGPAGLELQDYFLAFFNGANGTLYRTVHLNGTLPDDQNGWGFWVVGSAGVPEVNQVAWTRNGIQNGAPDGILLLWDRSTTHGDTVLLDALVYEPSGPDGLGALATASLGSLFPVFTPRDTLAHWQQDTGNETRALVRIGAFPFQQDTLQYANWDTTAQLTPGQANPGQTLDPGPTAVALPTGNLPHQVLLEAAYPNPFNGRVQIQIRLPVTSRVTVQIWNPLGQRVRQLAQGLVTGGVHHWIWDGLDEAHRPLSSGIYFLSVEAHPATGGQIFRATRRLHLIR